MIFEFIGAMLLTFLYLTQTEEKTKLSGDPAITTMIIATTYTACVGYSAGSGVITASPFNPAIALGEFFSVAFSGRFNKDYKYNMWICFVFSYAGALFAVLLFELVYKTTLNAIDRAAETDSDKEEEQLLNNNI